MPPNRGKPSVVAQIRAGRTFPGEVAIVEALTAGVPSGVVVIALLVGVSEAVKQGNRAIVALRAVRACLQEVEVEVVEAVAAVAVVVAAVAVEAAAVGAGRNRQAA